MSTKVKSNNSFHDESNIKTSLYEAKQNTIFKLFLIKIVGTGIKKEIHSKDLDTVFSNRFTK